MPKTHKHKWYKTTLSDSVRELQSYACKCGCWKVVNLTGQSVDLKITNWSLITQEKKGIYKLKKLK